MLHPRLFRGVTPNRQDGESLQTVVPSWLAHSGYPLDRVLPKESPDRCGTCAIYRTSVTTCLFTTSGSVVSS